MDINPKIKKLYEAKHLKRFTSSLIEGKNDCIETTVNLNKDGYGSISIGSRKDRDEILAHRYALQFAIGVILPSNIFVCHSCDNPSCVNPMHLFPGTHKDNMSDMKTKNRAAISFGNAVLNWDLVDYIRNSKETGKELSEKLNVSKATISDVRNNLSWKEENRFKAIIPENS
jgi:hypothetical protein